MPLLTVEQVSKSFGDNLIIKDTSFTVERGDATAFVSPSGSGKSTLLSITGLLLRPDSGRILTEDGADALALGDRELSRLRQRLFGFVFQSTQLIGSLTALENVTAPAGFAGKLPFKPQERGEELLERFGLVERLHHYPHQLSVGQKRRVAVARAMLLQPAVIIADEPTNDLDEQSAAAVADALFEYTAAGNALLFATHLPQLAARARTVMELEDHVFKPRA
ncbi:MAG: ABC transporter ATP-binding protein [Coriobacteriales bacterium]